MTLVHNPRTVLANKRSNVVYNGINGRSDRPMHLHTEYDLYYVQNYSILLDIQILWMTIWVVFRQKGAF